MKIKKVSRFLYGVGQLLNRPYIKKLNLKVRGNAVGKIDRPHLILANHSSVMDYRITSFLLRKELPYHIAAKNQFVKRRRLLSRVGALPKVQFQPSYEVVKNISAAVEKGKSVVVFPEGVVSFDGTNRIVPYSVAKLAKYLKIPVAVINIKGTYLVKPRYNEVFHKTDGVEADFNVVLDEGQVERYDTDKVYSVIKGALAFNVWQWNAENGIKTHFDDMCKGLDGLLYQCAECGGKTHVEGDSLCCECGRRWTADEYYRLSDGAKTYDIHEWFERQRQFARVETGDGFCLQAEAELQMMQDFRGFKKVCSGLYTHTTEGVAFEGKGGNGDVKLFFKSKNHFSAPVGNRFIEFSAKGVSYRFYFRQNGVAIKSAVAVEEIYKKLCADSGQADILS